MEKFDLKVEIHGKFATYSDSKEEVMEFVESNWLNEGLIKLESVFGKKMEGEVANVEESPDDRIKNEDGEEAIPFDVDFVVKATLSALGADQEQAKQALRQILESLRGEIEDILMVGISLYVEGDEL